MALLQKAYLGATPLFRNLPWFAGLNGVEITGLNGSGLTITAGSPAHTKGSWVELIDSTTGDSNLFVVFLQSVFVSATDSATVFDVGIGAAGSEVVVASNIAIGGCAGIALQIPVNIPSGSRVAARIAGVRSDSQIAQTFGNMGTFNVAATAASLMPSSVDVLGVDAATSTGTAMSGASGTWVEIVASTSDDYMAFNIVPSLSDTAAANIADLRMTLGVGPSGSEVAIGEVSSVVGTNESVAVRSHQFHISVLGQEVPAGSRLAIKHNIPVNPSKYDACIIAVPKV